MAATVEGGKYVMDVVANDNASKVIDKVSQSYDRLSTNIKSFASGHGNLARQLGAAALVHGLHQTANLGKAMVHASMGYIEGITAAIEHAVKKGGEFEAMLIRVMGQGYTREQATKMAEDALEITTKLPITEADALRMMTTLSVSHIDATKRLGESYDELAKKKKITPSLAGVMNPERMRREGATAISVMTDTLAALGHIGTGYQQRATQMLGQWIATGKNSSRILFRDWTKELGAVGLKAGTAEDRIKKLYEFLQRKGSLGISQATMFTLAGVMSNYKGLIDRVIMEAMQPGNLKGAQTQVVSGLMEIYNTIFEFFDKKTESGRRFLGMLRDLAQFVAGTLRVGMEYFASALRGVLDFASHNGTLIKFGLAVSVISAALGVLFGVILIGTSTIAAFIALAMMAPAILLAIPLAIGVTIGSLGLLTGALIIGAMAYESWVNNWGGIRDFFEGVSVLIGAAGEAWANFNGDFTHISEQTQIELEKRGMIPWFKYVLVLMGNVRDFWFAVSDSITARWGELGKVWGDVMHEVEVLFTDLGTAAGAVLESIFGGVSGVSESLSTGKTAGQSFADTLVKALQDVGKWTAVMMKGFNDFVGGVPGILEGIASIVDGVYEMVSGMAQLANWVGKISSYGSSWSKAEAIHEKYRVLKAEEAQKRGIFGYLFGGPSAGLTESYKAELAELAAQDKRKADRQKSIDDSLEGGGGTDLARRLREKAGEFRRSLPGGVPNPPSFTPMMSLPESTTPAENFSRDRSPIVLQLTSNLILDGHKIGESIQSYSAIESAKGATTDANINAGNTDTTGFPW